MNKILDWIKKNKGKTLLIIAAIVFIPIFTIHVLFKYDIGCEFLATKLQAGDVLGYFGDVLSFLGTIILGYIAILQTEKANTISEKVLELDLVKSKPCFDFVNSQKYFISLVEPTRELEKIYDSKDAIALDLLITANPRTGISTDVAIITFTVTNSGRSDIRFMYVNKVKFYLLVKDKRNVNEIIPMLSGNTNLKVGETRKMYVMVRREVLNEEDMADTLYMDCVEHIMPRLELDLHLVTTDGIDYYERIECATNWRCDMKSRKNCIERELIVTKLDVSTKK